MKKGILLAVAVLSFCGLFQSDAVAADEQQELGVTLDFTYVTKWLSKGVEAYGSDGGAFETLDLDFYGTGFGVKVTHRSAFSSGHADKQRFDYRPYYKGSLFDDQSYATKYNLSVGYEHYYSRARTKANTTYEWVLGLQWPQLLGNGLVPAYIAHYEYPESGKSSNRKVAGWVHRFLLYYDLQVPELSKPVKLSSEVAYYDGLGDKGSEWAYVTFGASTPFKINDNVSFVPGIYHQITMEDNISPRKDITYAQFSVKYKF
ncbi:MAG: hypothetical protein H8E62_08295 [Planctomycetes bacterium]|nr:hypothetical protein [Planctomycetota bacterium]